MRISDRDQWVRRRRPRRRGLGRYILPLVVLCYVVRPAGVKTARREFDPVGRRYVGVQAAEALRRPDQQQAVDGAVRAGELRFAGDEVQRDLRRDRDPRSAPVDRVPPTRRGGPGLEAVLPAVGDVALAEPVREQVQPAPSQPSVDIDGRDSAARVARADGRYLEVQVGGRYLRRIGHGGSHVWEAVSSHGRNHQRDRQSWTDRAGVREPLGHLRTDRRAEHPQAEDAQDRDRETAGWCREDGGGTLHQNHDEHELAVPQRPPLRSPECPEGQHAQRYREPGGEGKQSRPNRRQIDQHPDQDELDDGNQRQQQPQAQVTRRLPQGGSHSRQQDAYRRGVQARVVGPGHLASEPVSLSERSNGRLDRVRRVRPGGQRVLPALPQVAVQLLGYVLPVGGRHAGAGQDRLDVGAQTQLGGRERHLAHEPSTASAAHLKRSQSSRPAASAFSPCGVRR